MSDVSSIAAVSTAIKSQDVAVQVATKVLKLANDQEKSVLQLLEGAVASVEKIQHDCVDCYG